METLASFPTVQAAEVAAVTAEAVACPPSAAVPRPTGESLTRHTSARSARVVRLPPRSITVLSVVAAAVWAAVWWIERQRGLEDTAVQTAHAAPVETVTR